MTAPGIGNSEHTANSDHRDSPDPEEPDVTDNLFPSDDETDNAATPTATAPTTSATSPDASATMPARPRPRIRSGAIVWGFLVSATAVLVLIVVSSPPNSAAFNAWAGSLGVGGFVLVAVIALGAFILLMALLSVIRREQRKRAARAA